MAQFKRTLPYVYALNRIPSHRHRQSMFSHLPGFVADDIAEILYNIVMGNVHISKNYKNQLSKIRHELYKVIRAKSKKTRQNELYKQSGKGFIFPILLPAIASVIGSLISTIGK